MGKRRSALALLAQLALLCAVAVLSSSHLFYDLLELNRDATTRDVKKAFRRLALKYHPDKATDKAEAQRRFVDLVQAFETLEDPETRRR